MEKPYLIPCWFNYLSSSISQLHWAAASISRKTVKQTSVETLLCHQGTLCDCCTLHLHQNWWIWVKNNRWIWVKPLRTSTPLLQLPELFTWQYRHERHRNCFTVKTNPSGQNKRSCSNIDIYTMYSSLSFPHSPSTPILLPPAALKIRKLTQQLKLLVVFKRRLKGGNKKRTKGF